jgi:hypothetical protein
MKKIRVISAFLSDGGNEASSIWESAPIVVRPPLYVKKIWQKWQGRERIPIGRGGTCRSSHRRDLSGRKIEAGIERQYVMPQARWRDLNAIHGVRRCVNGIGF